MVQYATPEFFETLAAKLNDDAEFREKTAKVKADLLFVTNDRADAALLRVDHGKASSQVVTKDAKADFTFVAPYDVWTTNHRDRVPLEKLIMTGKVKFKGSIPKIMMMKSQLTIIDQRSQSIPVDY